MTRPASQMTKLKWSKAKSKFGQEQKCTLFIGRIWTLYTEHIAFRQAFRCQRNSSCKCFDFNRVLLNFRKRLPKTNWSDVPNNRRKRDLHWAHMRSAKNGVERNERCGQTRGRSDEGKRVSKCLNGGSIVVNEYFLLLDRKTLCHTTS